MSELLGSLNINNTKGLINPDTRICGLIYAKAKFGKTKLAAGLNEITLKYRNKPTLIIACEPAAGGGTASVSEEGIDYVMPNTWNEMEGLLASLTTNEKYGGVILDNGTDYISRIVRPHALTYPAKERVLGARAEGVPVRSDYQVMGEQARQQISRLVHLTSERTPEKYRKDLIVTALEKEQKTEDGTVTAITPDFPGALAGVVTAMFQEVGSVAIRSTIVPDPIGKPGATKKVLQRYLHVNANGMRVSDTRTGIFQDGFTFTDAGGKPISLLVMYEKWLERFKQVSA